MRGGGDAEWRASAQQGLDFIDLARNPYFAWRYGIKAWIDKMTDSDDGRTGYLTRGGRSARPQILRDRTVRST